MVNEHSHGEFAFGSTGGRLTFHLFIAYGWVGFLIVLEAH